MSRTPRIFFNGKFYAGGMNGVHRVSDRLIRACDALMAREGFHGHATLLAPENSTWLPELDVIRLERVRSVSQLWEQCVLPFKTLRGTLVNLANMSPVLHPRKLTMVHDVQFLLPDCGYSLRQRLGYRALVPLMGRTSRRTLTVSQFSRDELARVGIAREDEIAVIPNGVDHMLEITPDRSVVTRLGVADTPFVMMFGSPKPYKNNAVVFDAMRDLACAPVRLVVVGCDRIELERAGLRPPDDAVFAGKVNDCELRALLEGALALAFPSLTEGFGLPPLEAMVCGCPAIVNSGGAIPETCGPAAIFADGYSPIRWQRAIARLLADPVYREDVRQSSQTHAASFTWRRSARALLAEIEAVSQDDSAHAARKDGTRTTSCCITEAG